MAYATIDDVQGRMTRVLSDDEKFVVGNMLDDAAALIDSTRTTANDNAKKVASCRMVIRAIGDGNDTIPVGASQGSMSGLGYSQSWTYGSSGAVGEVYLTKGERRMLMIGDRIGSYSPVQELVVSS